MASITTHKYTSKTNNKENETCNGKRDEVKSSGRAGPMSDYEKQEAINQQRKLRLNQVRQQSKEIASQIRENVRCEEKRQLDKINEVKRHEMLNWRQKKIGQKDKDYKSCLEQVGDAHLAAERENMKQRRIQEQKEKNRKLALKRGKLAAQQIKGELKLNKCKPMKIPEKQMNTKSKATEAKDDSDVSDSSETSSDSSVISVELEKDVTSKSKTKSPLTVKWSNEISDYDSKKFASINSSTATDITLTDSPINDSPPVISKVSKLLQKSNLSDPRISKTYKLTKSPNKSIQNRYSTPPQREQKIKSKITAISSRLKKSDNESSGQIGLNKKQFVPEFVRNKSVPLINGVGQLNQVSNALRQKVNFYDHSNRFSKQYENSISLEENVHEMVPSNAWEEAERDIRRQRVLNKSKSDIRQFEDNCAKIALEKDRIRKDYDLMSKDLRHILKDESVPKNVSQSYGSMLESHSLCNSTTVQDRCDSSILLDFVSTRTNKICDDIDRCRNENGKNKSQTKIEALHGLLKKVNTLRKILFEEIKQNDNNSIDPKEIINEISKLEEEQNKIMSGMSQKMEKNQNLYQERERTLTEREELLKMKESCIDEKARELYNREKDIQQKKKGVQNMNGISKGLNKAIKVVKNDEETLIDETPVKIVINVNKTNKTNERSTDFGSNDVKWCERLRKTVQLTESRQTEPIRTESGKIYPKTPAIKTKPIPIHKKPSDNSSQSTSITAYMNPPELIQTQLSKALRHAGMLSNLKTQIGSNMNDNEMLHYIIRLLGMSRTSIEQLNLSTVSTVKTPDSSVINISSNQKFIASSTSSPLSISSSCSVEQTESIERNKLHQLARFLSENGNAIGNGTRQSHDSIENTIWNNILSQKKEEKGTKIQTNNEGSSEIGLANGIKEPGKHDLMTKYDELAASCTERIRNLDSMITKVREEKQKILENTLSSAESLMSQTQKENVTQYMDIPNLMDVRINQNSEHNGNIISSPSSEKSTNAPTSDFSSTSGTAADLSSNGNRINLTATRNKEFGESRDSGVGVSRPVTSSDFRESPDLRQSAKISGLDSNSQLLSLVLREEMQTKNKSTLAETARDLNVDDLDKILKLDSLTTTNYREKHPPIALTRYNSQIEDELPHELSTITEVDTPATSRLNATDVNCNNDQLLKKSDSLKNMPDNEVLKFLYNQFPNFKDYIIGNGHLSNASINDSVEVTAATSAILGDKLENLFVVDVPAEFLEYQKFNSETTNNEILKVPTKSQIAYKKFPSHFQYAQTASGLLDSQSIDRADLSDDTSLPDVLSELKARNIIDHSFEGVSSGEGSFKDLLAIPTNVKNVESTLQKKTDLPSDSISENLEQDLNSIGLKWATTILRKSKEISTSSSSISSNHENRSQRSVQRRSPKKISNNLKNEKNENMTSNTSIRTEETLMKSMNLKEFLARELLKHSSMSSSSPDSSLASIFLKSFLEPSKDSIKTSETSPNRGTDKHRTSTPVQNSNESKGDSKINLSIKSSTVRRNISENETSLPITATNDLSKFFSGGSHLSSVRSNSTDSTTASSDERH